jgi:signal transduction histidine kinase
MKKDISSLDNKTFKKLSRLYIIALSTIAISVIISQIIIRNFLQDQQNDSTIINIAGRQRMLSQKLTKEVLQISNIENTESITIITTNLKATLHSWKQSHVDLIKGNKALNLPGKNSQKVVSLYKEITPFYNTILNATNGILKLVENLQPNSKKTIKQHIDLIIKNENSFLQLMDTIVNQYNTEANTRVNSLRSLELLLMTFTLLILLGEFFFIFWPTAKAVKSTILKLLKSEKKALKIAFDADVLREKNEKSVKELRLLNQVMNQKFLFARCSADGTILHLGNKFLKQFKPSKFNSNLKLPEIITIDKNEQNIIEDLLIQQNKIGWQGEIKSTTKENENRWLEMSIIPFYTSNEKPELLIVALDITKRKEAQLQVETLTKKSFEETMNQQKIVSKKIIENQEKEQNRIAKDMHDGIGQMLTGLKYNLESINLDDLQKSEQKINHLKQLASNIIQGVRTATFNLTPAELSDYGIASALSKLTQELTKLTNNKIYFINKTGFNLRLEPLTEINIYRITQEAVNNAVKYAKAENIIVSISHSEKILSILIDDDGIGFLKNQKKETTKGVSGGMGMTFMQERIKYVNGRMFINSEVGKGTRITLNIPI